MTYYLTFGQQSTCKDGWVEVLAGSYDEARALAMRHFGPRWSMLYDDASFNRSFFPLGCLYGISEASPA